jgi:single-strand DNA-binding protein
MNGTLNKVMLIGFLAMISKCIILMEAMYWKISVGQNVYHKLIEKITSTEWHNLVVRNKAAELCEYLSKGDKICMLAVSRP